MTALLSIPEIMLAHAAALMTVIPLLLAALIFGLRLRGGATAIAATALCAWLAVGLISQTRDGNVVKYAFGGWEAPIGIEFVIDACNAYIALLIAVIGLLCCIANFTLTPMILGAKRQGHCHAALLICLGGLLGVALTGDLFNLFVFVEISSLASYALIALGKQRQALRASFNYLILGSIGATFYLVGIGFLYAATGSLNMQDIAARLNDTGHDRAIMAGLAFIVTGLGVKAALFPLHQWLPGSYSFAPPMVTAFLSGVATKAALYAMARLLFGIFGTADAAVDLVLTYMLAPLAAVGIVFCTIQAMLQTDVRLLLAYSSVAQSGYMLLAMALNSFTGMTAALLHMFVHAIMKSALFMALAGMAPDRQDFRIDAMAGAGRSAPITMAAFAICGLGLVGLPPTTGFASKWTMLTAAAGSGQYWAAGIIVVTGIMAFLYIWKILESAYMRPAPTDMAPIGEAPSMALFSLLLLAGASLLLGIRADWLLDLAEAGAVALAMPVGTGDAP